MSNNIFHFKQFSITQSRSAMKVSADAVMFGAWIPQGNYNTALDIGTGTGLLSIMLAQRFSDLSIDAVEIDTQACEDAQENIEKSGFMNRVHVFASNARHMLETNIVIEGIKPVKGIYDLIVSNPPFFTSSLPSENKQRNTARHDDSLSAADIFGISAKFLKVNGVIAVMYPAERVPEIKSSAMQHGFYLEKICLVHKNQTSPARLAFMTFTANAGKTAESALYMYKDHSEFTSEYKTLVAPYYLALE